MPYLYTDEDRAGFTRVQAGKRFRLFPNTAEIIESTHTFTRPLLLDSHELLPPFVIAIEASDYSDSYWEIPQYLITPFTKRADKQPVTLKEREAYAQKIIKGGISLDTVVKQNPYHLHVEGPYEDFCAGGIGRNPWQRGQDTRSWQPTFDPAFLKALLRLRFQVYISAGDETYEAMPFTEVLEKDGELFFAQFYPLTTGELAMPEGGWEFNNGDPIYFPWEEEKRQYIWGKFYFAATPSTI